MKIETIKDMEKLFNEGKLTHFVVKDDTESCFSCSYVYRSMKVKIICFSIPHIGFETISGGTAWILFLDVNKKETEKLIKGEKEMTKKDLKDGMVVVIKGHDARLMLNGCLIDKNGFVDEFKDDDILEVYKSKGQYFGEILHKTNLTLIWKREKSEAEIKLDNIEKQIEELQKSAKELREEINK